MAQALRYLRLLWQDMHYADLLIHTLEPSHPLIPPYHIHCSEHRRLACNATDLNHE